MNRSKGWLFGVLAFIGAINAFGSIALLVSFDVPDNGTVFEKVLIAGTIGINSGVACWFGYYWRKSIKDIYGFWL